MWQTWVNACLAVGDLLLGWSLNIGPEWALLTAGALSAIAVVLIRRFATPQHWLKRTVSDRNRLGLLASEARRMEDKPALRRIRATKSMIAWRRLPWELWSALLMAPLLAGIATWAAERTAYQAIYSGETVELKIIAPYTQEGELIHLLPSEGLHSNGNIRQLSVVEDSETPQCEATWRVRTEPSAQHARIRLGEDTVEHPIHVGAPYPPPKVIHDGSVTQIDLRPMEFFGWIPASSWRDPYLPPWMIVYLFVTIALGALLRRVFRVS